MAFSWADFLRIAWFLRFAAIVLPYGDAARRSCVSRAYYAAYCTARAYAEDEHRFVRTAGAGDHRKVAQLLNSIGKTEEALFLGQLRVARNQCDYDDVISGLVKLVPEAVRKATIVVARLG